jgi:ubiquinone/menaquinone biosynthesis C-methylase UbiE/uncharacterized protein YbaR (Trm112 family)
MMMLENRILKLLVCPLCKVPLEDNPTEWICPECNSTFFSRDGIFIFFNEEILKNDPLLKEEIGCQDSYLQAASKNNLLMPYLESHNLRELAAMIETIEGRVLDIGCGVGNLGGMLTNEIWGVDISKSLLCKAKDKLCYIFQASGYYLPFADNTFNIVFLHGVLHHVEDPKAIIKEARRVIKPGGMIISSDPRTCIFTKVARFLRRKNKCYTSVHRSFTIYEYCTLFKGKDVVRSNLSFCFVFYLLASISDFLGISRIIPAKEKISFWLFRFDSLLFKIFKFARKYNFIINTISIKE